VRILGEGSAGGNITHPSAVRDPIDTVFALLKLLSLRSTKEKLGLFEIWCKQSNQMGLFKENFTLTDVLASLPRYFTTGAYEKEAVMKIKSTDHSVFIYYYDFIHLFLLFIAFFLYLFRF